MSPPVHAGRFFVGGQLSLIILVVLARESASVDLLIAIEKNRIGPFWTEPELIREAGDVCPWIIFRDGPLYFAASAPDLAT